MIKRFYILIWILLGTLASCNKDEVITDDTPKAPEIELEKNSYTAKVGREIVISPTYKNTGNATYAWVMEDTGETISTEPQLRYTFSESNEQHGGTGYYLMLTVTNEAGSDSEELLVNVLEAVPPTISLAVPAEGLEIVRGGTYLFEPDVQNSENATYRWELGKVGTDGGEVEMEVVGQEPTYEFCQQETGCYQLRLSTENEDGSDQLTIQIEVVDALTLVATVAPTGARYDGLTRTVSSDRELVLKPYVWNANNPTYSWSINGQEVASTLEYTYRPSGEGSQKILFTVTDRIAGEESAAKITRHITRTDQIRTTLEFTVECFGEESSHKRTATGSNNVNWEKVYEYTPAPGQFINDVKTGGFAGTETTPEAAIAYAEGRMQKDLWVSLGGWGGYIVVGFDHSIESNGGYRDGYNFSIKGNMFDGSSEPGVVWVMQDTNGNSLPDDEWYELKGSEYGKAETIQEYAVTYYRPTYAGSSVQWIDNRGNRGSIDYIATNHTQPYYYPNWIVPDTYTFYGTRLPDNYVKNPATGYWENISHAWGYADNCGEDALDREETADAAPNKTYFKISNAIHPDGTPANLQYIDFIKVQTGINGKAGLLGELSTEVIGFTDENMNQGR